MERGNPAFKSTIPSNDGIAEVSTSQAATMMNVGTASVERAKKVLNEAPPETVADIRAGKQTVGGALKELKPGKTEMFEKCCKCINLIL